MEKLLLEFLSLLTNLLISYLFFPSECNLYQTYQSVALLLVFLVLFMPLNV